MIVYPQLQSWAEQVIADRAAAIAEQTGCTYAVAYEQAEQEYIEAHGSIGSTP